MSDTELIERYIDGDLPCVDRIAFEERLKSDKQLQSDLRLSIDINEAI